MGSSDELVGDDVGAGVGEEVGIGVGVAVGLGVGVGVGDAVGFEVAVGDGVGLEAGIAVGVGVVSSGDGIDSSETLETLPFSSFSISFSIKLQPLIL